MKFVIYFLVFLSAIWCFYRMHPVLYRMAEVFNCVPVERRKKFPTMSALKFATDLFVIFFLFWFLGSSFTQI